MTSLNFVKHGLLMHVVTPSLLKLSLLMRCLMLKIFTEFRKIFFHRTTSNSKMTAVRGNALKVVQSYLSNRKQYTQGENNKSSLN